ncbi:MAG: phosphate acyltransferase PlsX [Phycisphaerae bacterium]
MRIALDAMGGDHAPVEIIRGAVDALSLLGSGDELLLIGRTDTIESHLPNAPAIRRQIRIHHASDVIGMDEAPVEALRHHKDSSLVVMARLAADRQVDAVISAGNTGACAAACQLRMRTLGHVQRPGIAVVLPSFYGPLVICDVGANVAPKPQHLFQYAHMAGIYAEGILNIDKPRVGLLSIGGEDAKGSALVKQTRALIRPDARVNFIGNVEGRDLFQGLCDVVVTDGFTGNVVLKISEGLSHGLFDTIEREIAVEGADLAGRFKPVVEAIWARHDYSEYGGAPLLGINGVCIICHGSSKRHAIMNAIRVAREYVLSDLNAIIMARFTEETVDA